MQEAGRHVLIVEGCIAASRAAGTDYESINQSINHELDPRGAIGFRENQLDPGIVAVLDNLYQVPRLLPKKRANWHAETHMSINQAVTSLGMAINMPNCLITAIRSRPRIESERWQD